MFVFAAVEVSPGTWCWKGPGQRSDFAHLTHRGWTFPHHPVTDPPVPSVLNDLAGKSLEPLNLTSQAVRGLLSCVY